MVLPGVAWPHGCERYEYANLSVVQVLIEKDGAVESQKLYVSYNEESAIAQWMDDQPIAGSIKKPLKEYFGIKYIDKINILNSLGKRGWSAFTHQNTVSSKYESTDSWYLKKCVTT
jgi:hypothetical protein